MGYQESWFYIEPQWKFEKMIRAYEKAENSGYYKVAGAEPWSVVILKKPFGAAFCIRPQTAFGQRPGRQAAAVGVR